MGADVFKKVLPSSNFEYYICGPPAFMESVTKGLKEWGVPDPAVHFEAFGPASVKPLATPSAIAAPAGDAASKSVKVTFARSGRELPFTADSANLLELAERHGLSIPSGCRSGSCGTCVTAAEVGERHVQQDAVRTSPKADPVSPASECPRVSWCSMPER